MSQSSQGGSGRAHDGNKHEVLLKLNLFSKKPGSPGGGSSGGGKDFSFKVGPFSYNNNKGFTDRSAARNSGEDEPTLGTRDRTMGKGKIPSTSNFSHFNLFLIQSLLG